MPVILYGQFREADLETRRLLQQGALAEGRAVARALAPVLAAAPATLPRLPAELAPFADARMGLKLLLRPAASAGSGGFYYVAASPPVPLAALEAERARLAAQGVLDRLDQTCAGGEALALRTTRPDGGEEILTSVTPVRTPFGCFALVTAHSAPRFLGGSLGRPYWRTPEVQAALVIYVAMAGIMLAVVYGVRQSLRRFGGLARAIATGDPGAGSFVARNTVPELEGVAEDFDRLVGALHASADALRRAAEDNAHALKTPIAVIRQATEPLKRVVPAEDARGQRALDLIERSVDRLDGLVSSARRLDEEAADLLSVRTRPVDVAAVARRAIDGYASVLAGRGLRLDLDIAPVAAAMATEELVETVLENLLENAAGFSPPGAPLSVRVKAAADGVDLVVADRGPGVEPGNIHRIFDRYVSLRPPEHQSHAAHFGIGLWIVRRNVAAVGGWVTATNRPGGGLAVAVRFRAAPARGSGND
ncbi:MAG: sensor histidine kinase [Rhodospirillales bacterium]